MTQWHVQHWTRPSRHDGGPDRCVVAVSPGHTVPTSFQLLLRLLEDAGRREGTDFVAVPASVLEALLRAAGWEREA